MLFLWGFVNNVDNWSLWKVWLFSVLVIYLLMKDISFFTADREFDITTWSDDGRIDGNGGLSATKRSRVFLFGLLGPFGIIITWAISQFIKIVITIERIPILLRIAVVPIESLIVHPLIDKGLRKNYIKNMPYIICQHVLHPMGTILLTLFSLLPFGALILACTPMGKALHPDY
jgi:hypothetical protein